MKYKMRIYGVDVIEYPTGNETYVEDVATLESNTLSDLIKEADQAYDYCCDNFDEMIFVTIDDDGNVVVGVKR